MRLLVQQVIILLKPKIDQLLRKHTTNGELALRDAYEFKLQQFQEFPWSKAILCKDIFS